MVVVMVNNTYTASTVYSLTGRLRRTGMDADDSGAWNAAAAAAAAAALGYQWRTAGQTL